MEKEKTTKKKVGRPKLSIPEKRAKLLLVYSTEAEAETIKNNALHAGQPVSEFLRELGLKPFRNENNIQI